MKVTIDTKEDSHEDIKKILHILTNILQQKGQASSVNSFEINSINTSSATNTNSAIDSSASVDTTNMMNMFGNSSNETKEESAVPMTMFGSESNNTNMSNESIFDSVSEKAPDFSAFLNVANKEEKKFDPKVEYF